MEKRLRETGQETVLECATDGTTWVAEVCGLLDERRIHRGASITINGALGVLVGKLQ